MTEGLSWENLFPTNEPGEQERRWAFLIPRPSKRAEEEVRELTANPPEGGIAVRLIRGERCHTEQLHFEEWAASLGFPAYFGHNWDAFNEVVGEYLILEDGGLGASLYFGVEYEFARLVVVLVTRSEELLTAAPGHRLRTLFEILERAPLEPIWEGGKPNPLQKAEMRVIFQCEPGETGRVRERFERAGLGFPDS